MSNDSNLKLECLLEVDGLHVSLAGRDQVYPVLEDLSFSVQPGERLGIIGESGCGKTVTALALMGLLPQSMKVAGSIRFRSPDGTSRDLCEMDETEYCGIRGNRIGMIFQEPMSALNPVLPIGFQVSESLRLHYPLSRHHAWKLSSRMLERVGLPESRFSRSLYPHQLSGGQRQRVVIAIAMVCTPDLLIADEPTTALDVTIQSQILDLLSELVAEQGMSLILITHDLGVVAENTERMLVMYAGRTVEAGPTDEVFARLRHPYTRGLFEALPSEDFDLEQTHSRLRTIPGRVPSLGERPKGCVFHQRCSAAQARCSAEIPVLESLAQDYHCACWFPGTAA